MNTMPAAFIEELRALLEKHNAAIYWDCNPCSDLHGVSGQKMVIEVGREVVATIEGDLINAYELKD